MIFTKPSIKEQIISIYLVKFHWLELFLEMKKDKEIYIMDHIEHRNFQEIRFTAVSRTKKLDFGLQNIWTFEERSVLATCAFKVWKSLQNKIVLLVKRISYSWHFSLLYVVNKRGHFWGFFFLDSHMYSCASDTQIS